MLALGLLFIFSYFLGAIPTGYWIGKVLKGIDIRTVGSGSTGATNVLRSVGKGPAIFVLAFDMFKGALPVLLGISECQAQGHQIIPLPEWLSLVQDPLMQSAAFKFCIDNYIPGCLGGIIAMIAHAKSIFLGFGGGKSAATGVGSLAAMNIYSGLTTFAVFILTIVIGRYVSLGSMLAAFVGPFLMYYFTQGQQGQWSFVIYNVVGSSYVIIRHRSNIKRLLDGTEPKFGEKAKNKETQESDKTNDKNDPEA